MQKDRTLSIIGCLLGTAVGDALGLPYEGLAKRKIKLPIDRHRFLFGRGMVSDDTEHTCMVAQSLIVSAGDERIFAKALAWRLRFWLLLLPAGIGYATLKAIVKLWLGFPPHRSGVFSAGNGAAMRSAIIGICYGDNSEKMRSLVKIATKITHTDPKAEYGALAVALAAYLASSRSNVSPETYYQSLAELLQGEGEEFLALIKNACDRAENNVNLPSNLEMKYGISGYVYRTVPAVIQVWLSNRGNYRQAIAKIVELGGDTDTTAAILGGIMGASVGKTGIPQDWLNNLWEYPRSVDWLENLGKRLDRTLSSNSAQRALSLPIYALVFRNFLFLLVVIVHGFYRFFL